MFIRTSPGAPPYLDLAGPGRLRRLILTATGPLLLLIVPMTLVALYGEHLPDRVHIHNWAIDTNHEPWRGWLSQPLFGVASWLEAVGIVSFLASWRLPKAQRYLVACSFFIGVSLPASAALSWLTLINTPGAVARPLWHLPVEIAVTAGALALGWIAAGPLPPTPEAHTPPPRHAPTMTLGPWQRAMFVASAWSARRLLAAAVLAAAIAWVASYGLSGWRDTALLALLTLWSLSEMAQTHTRLQIDSSGVTVKIPWLPMLRRTVSYPSIRFAEARTEPPPGRYKLGDSDAGWGAVSGKGPVLALTLADGRYFVYSTHDAKTAAALVNGWLNRQRQGETA